MPPLFLHQALADGDGSVVKGCSASRIVCVFVNVSLMDAERGEQMFQFLAALSNQALKNASGFFVGC